MFSRYKVTFVSNGTLTSLGSLFAFLFNPNTSFKKNLFINLHLDDKFHVLLEQSTKFIMVVRSNNYEVKRYSSKF